MTIRINRLPTPQKSHIFKHYFFLYPNPVGEKERSGFLNVNKGVTINRFLLCKFDALIFTD